MVEVQFSEYFLHFIEEFNDYEKNMFLEHARNFMQFLVPADNHSLIRKTKGLKFAPFKNYEVLTGKKPYKCDANIKPNVLKDMFDPLIL